MKAKRMFGSFFLIVFLFTAAHADGVMGTPRTEEPPPGQVSTQSETCGVMGTPKCEEASPFSLSELLFTVLITSQIMSALP